MLPFPARQILPSVQIPIPSVSVQNPPVLLSPKSVCQPLSARTADGEASPFPASAGSKGITHTTFRGKVVCQGRHCPPLETSRQGERCSPLDSLCQQGCYSPLLDDLEPKGLCPSGHLACPCSGYPSCSCTMVPPYPNRKDQARKSTQNKGEFPCLVHCL